MGWRALHRPSELLATVYLDVYASFEFQPMLGDGEQLQKLTVTMEQLLEQKAKYACKWVGGLHQGQVTHTITVFTLFPENGDIVSLCSSILVTIKWQEYENSGPSASRVLDPQPPHHGLHQPNLLCSSGMCIHSTMW